jgi:hypothetical protein
MTNRISLLLHHSFRRVIIFSAAVALGCPVVGCGGGDSGTKTETPPPPGVKSMQDFVKQQAGMQKGAAGKQQRPAPPGK